MSPFRHPQSQFLRMALLLLLLSMQSFVLAHELDHGMVHNGNVCATCSVGSTNDGAVAVNHDGVLVVFDCQFEPIFAPAATVSPFRRSHEPRAPPASH